MGKTKKESKAGPTSDKIKTDLDSLFKTKKGKKKASEVKKEKEAEQAVQVEKIVEKKAEAK